MIDQIIGNRMQSIAIAVSIIALVAIIELIRRRRLKEEYAILWLATGGIFLALSIWRSLLEDFSRLIGISYPPVALIIFLIIGILAILLHFSLVISKMTEKHKSYIQELSILKHEFEKYKKKNPK